MNQIVVIINLITMIFVYNDNNTKISEISDIIKQRSERERERARI